ncbi:MAG: zinc ribbon domain-containing protein [Halioglobus sp.]|nr:zinc ribbon domain-containing protein [Halioglobus sp.]
MPIYEYQCQSCGEETEVIQKLSDEPLVDCPRCGKAALKKKVSAAAFRLKGGGWYETDFKTGDKKNLAGGGDEGKKDAAAKDKPGKNESGDSKPGKTPSGDGASSKKTA